MRYTVQIVFRMSEKMYEDMKPLCVEAEEKPSEFIRQAIRERIERVRLQGAMRDAEG